MTYLGVAWKSSGEAILTSSTDWPLNSHSFSSRIQANQHNLQAKQQMAIYQLHQQLLTGSLKINYRIAH